jgi:hypothetical protein
MQQIEEQVAGRRKRRPEAASNIAELEARELLTRREVALYLTGKGFPISLQHLTNLSMPSNFQGPPVALRWGQHCMHKPAEALAWARARAEAHTREHMAKAG